MVPVTDGANAIVSFAASTLACSMAARRDPAPESSVFMTVIVEGIDVTEDDQLVAVCQKDKAKLRISLSELPLPSPLPKGAEWIVAYRYWRTGKIR